jgi:hypothetical protein
MKDENDNQHWLNNLLSGYLSSECPRDVEKSMKDKITSLREKMEQIQIQQKRTSNGILWRLFNGKGFLWGKGVFPRASIVLVSLVFVVLGGFLQSKGSHSVLTESITTLKTLVSCNQQLYQAQAMNGLFYLSSDNEQSLSYTLDWQRPSQIRIRKLNPDKNIASTVWIFEEGIVLYDHTLKRKKRLPGIEELKKTDFKPIMKYLSPQEIMNFLDDSWQPKSQKRDGDCLWVTFSNGKAELKGFKQVTISECNFLPVYIKRDFSTPLNLSGERYKSITINLNWNKPIPQDRMVPPK